MDIQKVDMFMMSNNEKLPEENLLSIREKLIECDDEKWAKITCLQFQNPTVAIFLSLFGGICGIDRFYIGDTGIAIAKFLTFGGLIIWTSIDMFFIASATRESNYSKLITLI